MLAIVAHSAAVAMTEDFAHLGFAPLDFALLTARIRPAVLVAIALELGVVALDLHAKLSDGAVVVAIVASIVIVRECKRGNRERSKGDSEDGDFLETEHD
jgi:hypothetical protein